MSVGNVRLFLVEGTPGGLLTAEIMNWTGHVIAAPRSGLAALLKRPETSRTGLYLLLGEDPDSSAAYIGEGDDVGKRLYQHSRPEDQGGQDFWTRAVVLTSKDTNLTKAHARYLESRFITLAGQAARAKLTNSTSPMPISLPEADVSDMEYFISQAQIMLPVLGVNIFRSATAAISTTATEKGTKAATGSPLFQLRLAKDHLKAQAREIDGEFTVLAGSLARASWVGVSGSYQHLRARLEEDGVLVPSPAGQTMEFAHNQVFASPSAASAVILGRASNGRNEWKVSGSGISYGSWQNESLSPPLEA